MRIRNIAISAMVIAALTIGAVGVSFSAQAEPSCCSYMQTNVCQQYMQTLTGQQSPRATSQSYPAGVQYYTGN